jgi:hypothetical protein
LLFYFILHYKYRSLVLDNNTMELAAQDKEVVLQVAGQGLKN